MLQQVAPTDETGKQAVDKLMRVWLHGGDEAHIFIHLEVKSDRHPLCRTDVPLSRRGSSIVPPRSAEPRHPGDDRPRWRPHRFGYDRWGCALSLTFPTVKLLDFDQAALSQTRTLARRLSWRTSTRGAARVLTRKPRARAKLALARRLYRLGYDRVKITSASSASSNGCCDYHRNWKPKPGAKSATWRRKLA
ncbi:MAG: hypothetical protein U0841_02170 [Chloroflexia bacterium]